LGCIEPSIQERFHINCNVVQHYFVVYFLAPLGLPDWFLVIRQQGTANFLKIWLEFDVLLFYGWQLYAPLAFFVLDLFVI